MVPIDGDEKAFHTAVNITTHPVLLVYMYGPKALERPLRLEGETVGTVVRGGPAGFFEVMKQARAAAAGGPVRCRCAYTRSLTCVRGGPAVHPIAQRDRERGRGGPVRGRRRGGPAVAPTGAAAHEREGTVCVSV